MRMYPSNAAIHAETHAYSLGARGINLVGGTAALAVLQQR